MDVPSEIVELLFGSIEDEGAADQLGAAVANLCAAPVFHMHVQSSAQSRYLVSHNTSETLTTRYVEYFWRRDIWSERFPSGRPSTVTPSDSYVSDAEFLSSEIYTDLYRQEGDLARLAGAIAPLDEDRRLLIGVVRRRREPGFAADEIARLQGLVPLLRHVASARLRHESEGGRLAAKLLDADADPVLLVDVRSALSFANLAAQEALAAGSPLSRLGKGAAPVISAPGPDGARFARAVEWACSGRGGSVVRLTDVAGGVRSVSVDPLPDEPGLAAVRWRDAAARRREDLASARIALGLTAAETAVAEALMRGESPSQYAAARGVRITTVRSQLRSLFGKAGVSRQAELVVALKAGGARLGADG